MRRLLILWCAMLIGFCPWHANALDVTFDNKIEGDGIAPFLETERFTPADANEIKAAVNSKLDADRIVPDLAALKAFPIPSESGMVVYMSSRTAMGDGADGFFYWIGENLYIQCSADNLEGRYVKPIGTNGSIGAWVRFGGPYGRIEWFYDGSGDWTWALQAALNLIRGKIILSARTYTFDGRAPVNIPVDAPSLIGASSRQEAGTRFYYTGLTGPFFTNPPDSYISNFTMQDVEILSSKSAGDAPSDQDCFKLYGVTNNTTFHNVMVRNFGGNAWKLQDPSTADSTACGNVVFSQCFVVSVGKLAWDITGYVNAVWLMPDVNSAQGGGWKFTGGTTNQSIINIISPWYEGNQAWAGGIAISTVDANNQLINIVGGDFVSQTGTGTVIDMTGTSAARVNASGIVGYGWSYLINDHVNSQTVAWSTQTNHFYGVNTDALTVKSTTPFIDMLDTDGTTDQNRFRVNVSGTTFSLLTRASDGSAVDTVLSIPHSSKTMTYNGQITANAMICQSTAPVFDIYDTDGGTPDQRRFRFGIAGNLLTLDARTDDGTSAGGIVYFQHNSKMARFQGGIGVGDATANTNIPSGATAYKMPIHDAGGNLLGYIPVYAAPW